MEHLAARHPATLKCVVNSGGARFRLPGTEDRSTGLVAKPKLPAGTRRMAKLRAAGHFLLKCFGDLAEDSMTMWF
jgi:hypothetical protein